MADLAIYYEDRKLQPPVADALAVAVAEYGFDNLYQWNPETVQRLTPVLVLGREPEGVKPANYVKTLSQKQIMSNPAAMTELSAALSRLINPPVWVDPSIIILTGLMDANDMANLGPILVVDIETGGDIDIMTPEEMWLLSLAIYDGGGRAYVWTEEALRSPLVRQQIIRLLKRKKLIAHNMKFDFRSISVHMGEPIYGHCDTMLLHHAINPGSRQHGLKETAQKYLGAPNWDARTKEFAKGKYKQGFPENYPKSLRQAYIAADTGVGFEAIPRDILYPYNAWDVIWTWRLFKYLKPAVENDPRLASLAKMEYRYGNFFQDVESNGLAVDIDYVNWLDVEITGLYSETVSKIRGITEIPTFNINSPKQVKEWINANGLEMKSTGEQLLLDARPTAPAKVQTFIDVLLEARGYSKMHGTNVKGIKRRLHDGLVYSTFKVHGTNTGRLSSADPNVQNIPRDPQKVDGKYPHGEFSLRRIFQARDLEERILVECDYSQAELRVMACLSNDKYLISLFQPGMPDFFDSLMPIAYPHLDLAGMDPGMRKNLRAKLKGVIYGLSYGRRAIAIGKALEMPGREAQAIIDNYFRNAPEFFEWRKWVEAVVLDPEQTLQTPFGRYFQSEIVTGRNRQSVVNSGLAFLPQSTASDLCVNAAIEVQKWIGPEYDGKIIALIHDAILTDVPKAVAQQVGERIQVEMEASGERVFHGLVPFATEFTMGSYWEGI